MSPTLFSTVVRDVSEQSEMRVKLEEACRDAVLSVRGNSRHASPVRNSSFFLAHTPQRERRLRKASENASKMVRLLCALTRVYV